MLQPNKPGLGVEQQRRLAALREQQMRMAAMRAGAAQQHAKRLPGHGHRVHGR
jgi:hypothetical protein